MTPTVGIQMPIVFANWVITRKPSIGISSGERLVGTVSTHLAALYYLFIITGQFMLGRFDDWRDTKFF